MAERFRIDTESGRCNRLPKADNEWSRWVQHLAEYGALKHAECCIKKIRDEGTRDALRFLLEDKQATREGKKAPAKTA